MQAVKEVKNDLYTCDTHCAYCGRCIDDDYRFYLLSLWDPYGDEAKEWAICEKCYDEVLEKIRKMLKEDKEE